MDYEKEYKKLKADISKAYLYAQTDSTKAVLESILPELKDKENEDEKIREILIHIVKGACGKYGIKYQGIETGEEKLLAWLEKKGGQKPTMIQWTGDNLKELVQFTGKSPKFEEWFKTWEDFENYVHTHNNIFKIFNKDGSHIEIPVGAWIVKTPDGHNVASRYVFKQKPADKIEPKFHEGDFIKHNHASFIYKVISVNSGSYYIENIETSGRSELFNVEQNFHLWTIQDAKDGDVLATKYNDNIFLYNGKLDLRGRVCAYCGIYQTYDGIRFTKCAIGNYFTDKEPHPATKKQCNLLFQKMHDAGYTFDFEKKELKKVEDKPLVIDEGKDEIDRSFTKMMLKDYTKQKPVEWSEKDEKTWKELIEEVKDQLDSVSSPDCRDKEDEKALKQLTRWFVWLKSLKERVQPKQEWSEEDDNCLSTIIAEFSKCAGRSVSKDEWMRCNDFLNSLKDKVQPQRKQEWSEEDEHKIEDIVYFLDAAKIHYAKTEELDACIDWLKSLRPSKRRPTPEQYNAPNRIANFVAERLELYCHDAIFNILKQLRTELKAL